MFGGGCRCGSGACGAGQAFSGAESVARCGLCGVTRANSGGEREDSRHRRGRRGGGEDTCAAGLRRRGRAEHLPAGHGPRRLCADDAADRLAMGQCDAVGDGTRIAVPPNGTSGFDQREWARDYNEVKDIGGKKSTMRTPEQTEIARFWVITGPQSYDPIARQLAAAPGRSLSENARLFALVEMAVADAYVAVFDAKYMFNFWRPITAIRNGDTDGNDATIRDAGWEPVIDTPLHPEYPCAHCITSGAARAVLESEFGTGAVSLSMTSASAPGVVHKWASIQEWAEEVAAARIYGGIHYRNSTVVGKDMGRKIGELAVKNYLKPAQ